MAKFHINKKGEPAICRATKGNCPFGGNTGTENHFDSMEEAQKFADKQNEITHSYLPTMNLAISFQTFKNFLKQNEVAQENLENFINHFYRETYKSNKFSKSLLGRMELKDSQVHLEILESPRNKSTVLIFLEDKLGMGKNTKDYVANYNQLQAKIEDIVDKQYKEKYGVNKFSKSVLGRLEFTEEKVYVGINKTPYNDEDYIEIDTKLIVD